MRPVLTPSVDPGGRPRRYGEARPRRSCPGLWAALPLAAALLLIPVAAAEAQDDLPSDDRHGKEGTWNLGPKQHPRLPPMEEDEEGRFTFDHKNRRVIDCHLREVQELGRIYVQELSGAPAYWIQLPDDVRIRAVRKADFDGRRKLKLEDLKAGQRLKLTLRKTHDEILVVRVRPS